jgi:hypothetical protein
MDVFGISLHIMCATAQLVLISSGAFPLVADGDGTLVGAAAYFGTGRIVVFGHESFIAG